jgi:eukaryotic-like serine/threonine-protein kinase
MRRTAEAAAPEPPVGPPASSLGSDAMDAPRTLGRYELRHALGTGGMASVHLALVRSSEGFHKAFAVKRMHPHLAQISGYAAMFIDEARIASRIEHPNVCAVVDFGEVDGELFMAMELLMGEPFGRLLARLGRLSPDQRSGARPLMVSLLADACEGVHAAHELETPEGVPMRVVHRDISPHNLVVTYDGVMKVLDFGVARSAGQRHQTVTGEVKGKFSYMAPEQMRGEAVDRRADVWSLGVVLWETLAARPLFRRGNQSETILAVLSGEVPSLTGVEPAVDPELDAIVRRALSPDPSHRYPTARALARALRGWVAGCTAPIDAGHTAQWMAHLFPEEQEAQRQRLRALLDAPPPVEVDVEEPPTVPSRSMVVQRPVRGRSPWHRRLLVPAAVTATAALALVLTWSTTHVDAERPAPPPPPVSTAAPPAPLGAQADPVPAPGGAPAADAPPGEADPGSEAAAPEGPSTQRAPAAASEARAADAKPARRARRAPRRGTTTARPQQGTGKVNIAVRGGWANVYLGRRLLGPTPGTYTLPAGRHVLRLRDGDGGVIARVPVRVEADGTAQVAVKLD